ncbi:uncharacterized protein LOC110252621 [Exaiptasia diaphana]|uniref:Uncharacterized protein n=1 Tax=Exaiptasia diaphana TaxID=2652724 RepID=A0A913YV29_EXADI|nr:uncharacterized protein LOC110252621 [Exaiptasia diaphana]
MSDRIKLDTESNPSKIIGYLWDKRSDTLEVKGEEIARSEDQVTKRGILSSLSSLYDPLGLISQTLVRGKEIYPDAWDENKSWNATVSDDIAVRWSKWTSNLCNVKVPRSIPQGVNNITGVHLHLFGDASKTVCSTVAIAVIEHSTGVFKGMLTSMSTILKQNTTIPRLELISGHMAANMAKNINTALQCWPIKSITIWMDSMMGLYWICNPGKPWKVFVSNRVRATKITNDLNINWKYCPSNMNLADLGSRGASLNKMETGQWFEVPDWLLDKDEWPSQPKLKSSTSVCEESSPTKQAVLLAVKREPDELENTLEKYTYWKTVRITAWALRFLNNCHAKTMQGKDIMPLTTEEINREEVHWVRKVQADVSRDSRLDHGGR